VSGGNDQVATDGIRPQDIPAFKLTAKLFKVHILLRATNPASLGYVGQRRYEPKRLDCKAKTADRDVTIAGAPRRTAGLVVDPMLAGPTAFEGNKYAKALKSWEKFRPLLAENIHGPDGKPTISYYRRASSTACSAILRARITAA